MAADLESSQAVVQTWLGEIGLPSPTRRSFLAQHVDVRRPSPLRDT
jgi:hypothetical protein